MVGPGAGGLGALPGAGLPGVGQPCRELRAVGHRPCRRRLGWRRARRAAAPGARRRGAAGRRCVRPRVRCPLGQGGLERPRGGHHRPPRRRRCVRPIRPLVGRGMPRVLTLRASDLRSGRSPPIRRSMSFAPRLNSEEYDLLRRALAILPKLPDTIEVISEDGGTLPVTLAAVEGTIIYAYGDRDLVRDDLILEARPRDEAGDGHDIRFKILRSYFQSGDELLLHLKVIEVEERSGERASPRAPLAAQAALRVLFGREQRAGFELDIRLVDVSPNGVAFIADRGFVTGDIVEIYADVHGNGLRLECRVVESIP